MQDLKVIGVENGALLVASEEGTRFRIAIDEVLQSKLRQSLPDPGVGRKLAPREIQAHIRSGMSAEDVASITGVPLEYIQKFEGPVLAEREFVVTSALSVPVHTAIETAPDGAGSTFGTVIRERLYDLGAVNERWASWKEVGGGWIVKLSFTASEIDHDARWSFDPRKSALAPLNSEANTLSQQGQMLNPLVPRLRAVGDEERMPDQSRFDSGAFSAEELDRADSHRADSHRGDTSPRLEVVPYGRLDDAPVAVSQAAITRAPILSETESHQTADLLEALRRRRGEREAASYDSASYDSEGYQNAPFDSAAAHDDAARSQHPSTGAIRLVDIPLSSSAESATRTSTGLSNTGPQSRSAANKKGRATMPSWDEIVFGARSEEEQP